MGRVIIEGSLKLQSSEEKAVICSACKSVIGITRDELKQNSSRFTPYTYLDCPVCQKQIICDWISDTYEFASAPNHKKRRPGKTQCHCCGTKFKYEVSDILLKGNAYYLDEYAVCPGCLSLNNIKSTVFDNDDYDCE